MTNLERWRYYLQDLESPDIFINWSLFYSVSASLQRRVWHGGNVNDIHNIYPNIYVVFVSPPGIGKSMAAVRGLHMLNDIKAIDKDGKPMKDPAILIAPDSTTLEAITDYLAKNHRKYYVNGQSFTHWSLCFYSEELGTLFKQNATDVVSFLQQGYDCHKYIKYTKTQGCDEINKICVSFLGCTTAQALKRFCDNEVLSEGMSARTLFIYAEKPRFRKSTIKITDDQKKEYAILKEHFTKLTRVNGNIVFTPEAKERFDHWYLNEYDKIRGNKSPRLDDYYGRKKLHVIKQAIVMHYLENLTPQIDLVDVESAIKEMLIIEEKMHMPFVQLGKNPIHQISTKLLEYVNNHKEGVSEGILRLTFSADASKDQILEALTHLKETYQIKMEAKQGKNFYLPIQ